MKRRSSVDAALRVNLTLPKTRFGVGPLSFDPLEQLIGARVVDLLEPLMVGPVQSCDSAGPALEIYPLALPAGEGAAIPLGRLGELGFANEDGLLALTVPWGMASWLCQRLGASVVRGPEPGVSLGGGARIARLWVELCPGARASFPLGSMGEIGVEAA